MRIKNDELIEKLIKETPNELSELSEYTQLKVYSYDTEPWVNKVINSGCFPISHVLIRYLIFDQEAQYTNERGVHDFPDEVFDAVKEASFDTLAQLITIAATVAAAENTKLDEYALKTLLETLKPF